MWTINSPPIPKEVLTNYFKSSQTIPQGPKDNSLLAKHKTYVQPWLSFNLLEDPKHVNSFQTSLLKMAYATDNQVVFEDEKTIYGRITLLFRDLESQYEANLKCKEQSEKELECLTKLKAEKANLLTQFKTVEEIRETNMKFQTEILGDSTRWIHNSSAWSRKTKRLR